MIAWGSGTAILMPVSNVDACDFVSDVDKCDGSIREYALSPYGGGGSYTKTA